MFKVPLTKGNYISDYACKDWVASKVQFVVDANGKRQLKFLNSLKMYYPNGLDASNNPQYGIRTLANDWTSSYSGGTGLLTFFIYGNQTGLQILWVNRTSVGTSPELTPSNPNNAKIHWWDTTNNIIKQSEDNGSTWVDTYRSLPIGYAHWDTNIGFTNFIPFEFCGFMGNGFFQLPITKVAGYGFDASGNPVTTTYIFSDIIKDVFNTTYSYSNLSCMLTMTAGKANVGILNNGYYIQDEAPATVSGRWYSPKLNQHYIASSGSWVTNPNFAVARFSWNGTTKRVTDFQAFTTMDECSRYYF